MKVLIVDDEPLARVRMRKLLLTCSDKLEIDEAENADKAFKKIVENKPFAVFLDIQMPCKGGFELVESLAEISVEDVPYIIFVTAFSEYAINAFDKNAIDYLLKPVEQERLQKSVEKLFLLENSKEKVDNSEKLLEKLENLKTIIEHKEEQNPIQKLRIKVGNRTLLIDIEDIVRFESDEKFTTVYTINNRYVMDTPIVVLESKLPPKLFLKIHRAHLVALNRITEIRRIDTNKFTVVLNDAAKTTIPVGRSYVDKIKEL